MDNNDSFIKPPPPEPTAERLGRLLSFGDFLKLLESLAPAIKDYVQREVAALKEDIGTFRYCGVWERGRSYGRGSFCTRDGSMWHANTDTTQMPGDGPDWTLAVKRGRDAKEPKQ